MRLPRPFFQLPLLFDAARLHAESAALAAEAWVPHPDRLPGNSAVPLISPGGGDTESFQGRMLPTRWLAAMPYVRQILTSLGVVWSHARLMRLAPGAEVPEHADINLHWHTRVRMHIPVLTCPQVCFHCGGEAIHMAAGEAWIFDNWRRHRVENPGVQERIHLVADTTGTAAFWQLAMGAAPARGRWRTMTWQSGRDARPMTECNQSSPVLPAADVDLLISDLGAELTTTADTPALRERAGVFSLMLRSFVHDWRQLCALHGTRGDGLSEFRRLAGAVHNAVKPLAEGLVMRTNGVSALHVLEARVLKHLVEEGAEPPAVHRAPRLLRQPVFIVAAPRSGSTLLFETLGCSPGFNTFGGEAHWLIEDHAALRPGAPGVNSNRLAAVAATPEIAHAIRQAALGRLQGSEGRAPLEGSPLLEKTPKNSLRVPFLKAVFPDARFIFLWRDPRENVSSIMEAWRSGGWVTYSAIPGWDGPWSMLLPPAWPTLRGASPAAIAALQWASANDTALDDLQQLPCEDWTAVRYGDFLRDPAAVVRRLCKFVGVHFDHALAQRTAGALPPSRHTLTPPVPNKWRRNEEAIESVMPGLDGCWQRLLALG